MTILLGGAGSACAEPSLFAEAQTYCISTDANAGRVAARAKTDGFTLAPKGEPAIAGSQGLPLDNAQVWKRGDLTLITGTRTAKGGVFPPMEMIDCTLRGPGNLGPQTLKLLSTEATAWAGFPPVVDDDLSIAYFFVADADGTRRSADAQMSKADIERLMKSQNLQVLSLESTHDGTEVSFGHIRPLAEPANSTH
ncbi:MAG TPA: hypothetical protein VG407_08465 [Caulobacteraceae bacterium]|jgi:hypothetical protein|nr:hypothetical protein [Caulobacteraceae bacterium]